MQRLDQFSFHPTLAEQAGPALVFFTAAACASCRHWHRLLTDYAAGDDSFPVFEVDAGQDQALAREFELFHLPALFLYRDGHYHRPVSCEASLLRLRAAISAALALPAEEAP